MSSNNQKQLFSTRQNVSTTMRLARIIASNTNNKNYKTAISDITETPCINSTNNKWFKIYYSKN